MPTKIEWTDETWNPITGCTLVSEGCTNCYAARLAATRLKHHPSRKGLARLNAAGVAKFTGEVRLNEQWLPQPLRWKRPRMIFVCAHGDLFHEDVPDEWIDQVFAIMALCPQHTFQLLTKRPERMREYCSDFRSQQRIAKTLLDMVIAEKLSVTCMYEDHWPVKGVGNVDWPDYVKMKNWPLPNLWLGTSIEDQETADARIPHLLKTPAAIRFVCAEPMLSPVDLYNGDPDPRLGGIRARAIYLGDWWEPGDNSDEPPHHGVDWVIVGGESGANVDPMHPDWARSLRDQCAAAQVPFFFKQWGNWKPGHYSDSQFTITFDPSDGPRRGMTLGQPPHPTSYVHDWQDGTVSVSVKKSEAGRLLDGVEHNAMPERQS